MARSSYIYVITDIDEYIMATFTVKWEALTYKAKHYPDDSYKITRYPDGRAGEGVILFA